MAILTEYGTAFIESISSNYQTNCRIVWTITTTGSMPLPVEFLLPEGIIIPGAVYKTLHFWNTKAFLPKQYVTFCRQYERMAQIQNFNPGIYDEFIYLNCCSRSIIALQCLLYSTKVLKTSLSKFQTCYINVIHICWEMQFSFFQLHINLYLDGVGN